MGGHSVPALPNRLRYLTLFLPFPLPILQMLLICGGVMASFLWILFESVNYVHVFAFHSAQLFLFGDHSCYSAVNTACPMSKCEIGYSGHNM